MSSCKAWLAGSLLFTQVLSGLALTQRDVGNIANDVKALITSSYDPKKFEHPILGTIVRLVFHDCAGQDGCDGCLGTSLPENSGLDEVIDSLETVYTPKKNLLSRADFWALAGIQAVNMGIANIPGNKPPLPPPLDLRNFQTGRKDCSTPPNSITDVSSSFPSALLGPQGVKEYFATNFKFNAAQTVAIMGAHNLGKGHAEYSGFNESWTRNGKALGTEYYANMADANMGWVQAPVGNGNYRWRPTSGAKRPTIMMLDADMALLKNISTPNATGQVACTYTSCPATAQFSGQVTNFARNLGAFLSNFADAFTKMLSVCGRPSVGAIKPCTFARPSP